MLTRMNTGLVIVLLSLIATTVISATFLPDLVIPGMEITHVLITLITVNSTYVMLIVAC